MQNSLIRIATNNNSSSIAVLLNTSVHIAGKSTSTVALYRDTWVLHKADQRYTCEVCNKKFDRKAYLVEHLEIHTGKEGIYNADI